MVTSPYIDKHLEIARQQIAETQAKLLESEERVAMLEDLIERMKQSRDEREAQMHQRWARHPELAAADASVPRADTPAAKMRR